MTTKHQQITNLQQRNVKSTQPSVQDRPSHVTLTRFVGFLTDLLKPSIVSERIRPNRSITYRIGKSLGRKLVVTRPKLILGGTLLSLSLAVLFDVSGSMEGRLRDAREAALHVLSWMDASRDEAAIYTFDTHLDERMPFTAGLKALPDALSQVVPFGATSLHDAIAETARRVGTRDGLRRAVVVLTDGADNASRLAPSQVSAMASAIDVPVYIF